MIEQNICFVVVYLAEALTAWQFFGELFSPRRPTWVRGILFGVGYGLAWLCFALDFVHVNVLIFAVCTGLILYIGYTVGIGKAALYAVLLSALMLGTEYLSMLFLGAFFDGFGQYKERFAVLILFAVFSKVLYFICTRLYVHIAKSREQESPVPNVVFILMLVTCLSSVFVITALIYICLELPSFSRAAEFWMIGCAMALLLGNILIFAAYQYIQQMNQRYMDLRLQQQKEQADRSYYKTLQEQYDNQRIMIHDIRYHLAAIKEMAEVQNRKVVANYVSEMERLPALQRRVQYCKDPVLNTLLIRYRDLCQERGISFSVDIRKCAVEGMDSIDITSLFGNLMENALEAAQGSENPFLEISLDVREAQKAWVLTIVNSCKEPPETSGMGFISRKQKRGQHGIGLMSVKRIMKKYKGNLEQYYEENDKTFHSVVVFPVNISG